MSTKFGLLFLIILSILKAGATDKADLYDQGYHTPQPATQVTSAPPPFILLECIKVTPDDHALCKSELIGFINTLTLSPKANILLDEIKSLHGFIHLTFPLETSMGALSTGAHWDGYNQTIVIERRSLNNTFTFCRNLLLELCNAANTIIRTNDPYICGDPDIYSFLLEAAEYFSAMRCDEIIRDYSNVRQLGDVLNSLLHDYENFMEFWTAMNQKHIGQPVHADGCRYRYREIISSTGKRLDQLKVQLAITLELLPILKGLGREEQLYAKQKTLVAIRERLDCFPYDSINSYESIKKNAEYLIVYAFGQNSFDLAKKESRLLKRLGSLPDNSHTKKKTRFLEKS